MTYESSDEQLMKSYSDQRKERLDSAVFDYLSEEGTNAQEAYDDMIDIIKRDAAYFKRYYEKCRDLLWKMGYYGSVDEEFALFRLSHSVPTDEQILKSYHDEKSLFEDNAKAGVYGGVDSVTDASFDKSTGIWHAGTSHGRSDFKGLRRINNTTTSASKVAAAGGLVIDSN